MVDDITKITPAIPGPLITGKSDPLKTQKETEIPSFSEVLKKALNEVNELQGQADKAIKDLALGDVKDIHQTIIALEKANVSLQLMMEVRNKIVEAYREIMRLQT